MHVQRPRTGLQRSLASRWAYQTWVQSSLFWIFPPKPKISQNSLGSHPMSDSYFNETTKCVGSRGHQFYHQEDLGEWMMDASVVVAPQDVDAGGSGRQYGKNKDVTFGPAVDAVMEQIRHRFTIASVRSLFTCVGLGEAEPFMMPSQSQILPRLKANGNFYLTNYLLVAAFVFFFILLFFHPIQLVICMVVAWGWYIVLTKKDSELEHVRICGRRVGEQEILLVTTGSSIVFLVFYILPEMLVAIAVSSMGCSIHALLRNNRLKDDDAYSVLPQKEVSSSSAESPEEPV